MLACLFYSYERAWQVVKCFIEHFPVDVLAAGDFEHQVGVLFSHARPTTNPDGSYPPNNERISVMYRIALQRAWNATAPLS